MPTPKPPNPVTIRVDIVIDMTVLRQWPADKIKAFFQGVAEVVDKAAKLTNQAK